MTAHATRYRRPADTDIIAQMNITPLIDVLLVLLVMMILTVPIVTHNIPVDLPAQPLPGPVEQTKIHRVDLSAAGGLAWDGAPIADAALPAKLAAFMAEDNAQLQIKADAAARYERFDRTLAVIKRAGVTRLGFVGNERFRDFGSRVE